ncbi:hypothetical protein LWC34_15425 [Kibdelosporangium philippinense]|uniref:Uncharacterized protein n=1 Tax=Kibdelosporangium philippinense TaxID=211113 RepID=A0ABS8Z8K9_9PSEU|nr:hypothetical protein [Kibdelosporangium philippinense]MCE7004216.1 hypothetical protein [Kibdelosporangium philippinense]
MFDPTGSSGGRLAGMVDYSERSHAGYAAGRKMSPVSLRTWMAAPAVFGPVAWVDVGSGARRMTLVGGQ